MSTIQASLHRSTFPQTRHLRRQWMDTGRWAWLRRLGRCKYSIISPASSWTTALLQQVHPKITKGKWVSFRTPWTTTIQPKPRTLFSIIALCHRNHSHPPTSTNLRTASHLHHLCSKPPSALDSLSPTSADANSYNNNVRKNRNCSSSWTLADTTRSRLIRRRLAAIQEISKTPRMEQELEKGISLWCITRRTNTATLEEVLSRRLPWGLEEAWCQEAITMPTTMRRTRFTRCKWSQFLRSKGSSKALVHRAIREDLRCLMPERKQDQKSKVQGESWMGWVMEALSRIQCHQAQWMWAPHLLLREWIGSSQLILRFSQFRLKPAKYKA